MAAELQALFDKLVFDFLTSCQGKQPPLYGTRRTLGKLAESVSSWGNQPEEGRPVPNELWQNGQQSSSSESGSSYREENQEVDKEDDEEMDDEESNGVADQLTEGGRRMMTRSQLRTKRKQPSSELMSGDEDEDKVELDDSESDQPKRRVSRRVSKRRNMGVQSASKRRKVSSNSDEEDEMNIPGPATVTRMGRTVKPTVRFS